MYYALLFFIPMLLVMGMVKLYFHLEYTWKEFAIQSGVTLAVVVALFLGAGAWQTSDTKIVNGVVTELDPKKESCPSSLLGTSFLKTSP